MRHSQWVGFVFQMFLRLIGAVRFTRAASGWVVALLAGGAIGLWQPITDAPFALRAWSETYLGLSDQGKEPQDPSSSPSLGLTEAAGGLGERLTPEQSNLARFIALRYRVALERAQVFVDAAYRAARDYRLDPALILAVISVESGFDPSAVSSAGAHGLMQVLTRVHVDRFQPFGGAAAAFDPIANIRVGAQILREYIARDGSVENALRAYVGAATAPDDQGYGAKVLAERARFSAVAAGRVLPVWNSAARSLPEPPRQAPASAPAHGAEDTSIPSYPTSVGASEAFLAEGQIPSLIVAN